MCGLQMVHQRARRAATFITIGNASSTWTISVAQHGLSVKWDGPKDMRSEGAARSFAVTNNVAVKPLSETMVDVTILWVMTLRSARLIPPSHTVFAPAPRFQCMVEIQDGQVDIHTLIMIAHER